MDCIPSANQKLFKKVIGGENEIPTSIFSQIDFKFDFNLKPNVFDFIYIYRRGMYLNNYELLNLLYN